MVLFNLEHGDLRTIHDTVITFETQTATHTTFGFRNRFLFAQHAEAVIEIAQCLFRIELNYRASITCNKGEVAEEQFVGWNYVLVGTILKIMNSDIAAICAPCWLMVIIFNRQTFFQHFALQVKVMHVDFRTFLELFGLQITIDTIRSDCPVTNRSR